MANRAADALQPDLAADPLQRLRSLTTAVDQPESERPQGKDNRTRGRGGAFSLGLRERRSGEPQGGLAQLVRCRARQAVSGCSERQGLKQSDRLVAGCPYSAKGVSI